MNNCILKLAALHFALQSRIWAGIHFPMDNVAGLQLGTSVSQVFIAWAQSDGSQ
ncbi:MAG: hypothetical protein DMG57_05075 [Acidobacteria bacterium]|nr:MAG: hypothetical protein DMG57_05075 [Acidobacteriota bacterium]